MCFDQDNFAEAGEIVAIFEVAATVDKVDWFASDHDDHFCAGEASIEVLNDFTKDGDLLTFSMSIENGLYRPVHSNILLVAKL